MSFLASNDKSTIVITGGSTGIGLALAKHLIALGHTVIVVDKIQQHIDEAMSEVSQLKGFLADVSTDEGRTELFQKVAIDFPDVNVLINNAGVNYTLPPLTETTDADWSKYVEEQQINYVAPVHLSMMFMYLFGKKKHSLIANVSDVLAFVPDARFANYSASKAGTHSITLSMRQQMLGTHIRVVEIIPPLVETNQLTEDLRGKGMDADEFAKSTVNQLIAGASEIGYHSVDLIRFTRDGLDKTFSEWNNKKKIKADTIM